MVNATLRLWCILFFLATLSATAKPDTLRVAVSSNFAPVLQQLVQGFEDKHHIRVQLISAATGTLYQQILHGAPFDVFLSADSVRPERLAEQGLILEGSLKAYAIGQLSFYSAKQPELTFEMFLQQPTQMERLAIANPAFAPYGVAAKQALINAGIWKRIENQLILGININQTFQQVHSKSATAGIVATSQLVINKLPVKPIPHQWYDPIIQKAVIIKTTQAHASARQFLNYILSASVQQELISSGYLSPTHSRL